MIQLGDGSQHPSFPNSSPVILFQSKLLIQVMDRNRDGKLMMEEVEQCLIPGTYRYREFHKALKLSTPEGFKAGTGMEWMGDGRGRGMVGAKR